MKNKFLFVLLLMASFFGTASAQITDVFAGNDTIELRIGNYHYGFVQWQTSNDTINWIDIEGATDTVYSFMPKVNAYYRARATFPNCPEEYSDVCYVQVPPKADAGPDRNLPQGGGATMFAKLEEGCVGEWVIISGENGSLSDYNSPNAYFEGTDSEYKLKWTVTNACGSDSDTLTVKYFHTIMNDNYLVVDTTDFILSDSMQMLNGEFVIAFSEPVAINDSILLVGVGERPFLRKVISYQYDDENDWYVFETSQGTLNDFLKEGVFSFDFATAFRQGKKMVVSNRFPTRKDIAELGWNGVYYRQPKEGEGGIRINFCKGAPKLNWTPGFVTLPWDFAVVPTLSIDEPNFLCEFKHSGWHVESIKFGLYNTQYLASLQFYIPGKTSFSIKKKLPIWEFPVALGFLFIGPIVAVPELTSDLTLSLQYSLGPEMSYFVVQNGFVNNYIMYDDINGWVKENSRHSTYDFDAEWPEYGTLTGKVAMGVKLGFYIYDCLGPYAGFSLSFEGTHNTFGEGFTAEQFKLKEQFEMGLKFKVLGYDILDFNWPFVEFEMLNYQNPYSIHYHSGNNQYYNPGQQISQPLSVLVKNSRGKPSKGVRVKFETGGFSHPTYTDNQGFARVYWTPDANSSGTIQARAYSYNVKNEPVQGAPVIFNTTSITPGGGGGGGGGGSWGDPNCTTLSVTADYNNGVLKPKASGGRSPWLYSTDGVSYGSQPTIIPVEGQTYHFFVQDNNQCVVDCYYTHPTQDCSNSTLNLQLSSQGNTVTAQAYDGQSPYQYALDEEPYGSANVFPNLMNGEHIVNVRDANGCVDVASITLDAYGGGSGGGAVGGNVTVTTSPTVNVYDATSAHGSGSVSITGNATVSIVGLCWSRHHSPTTSDEYVQQAYSGNSFGNLMVNLTPNVIYYLRAFAVTNTGTVYGNEVGFSTTAVAPMVTCGGVGNITPTTARALGNVSNVNGTFVTERGFCWSTNHNPTIYDDHFSCGFGTGAYSCDLEDLTPDTQYYLRAYAINSEGIGYSNELVFQTFDEVHPSIETYVVTLDASDITTNSALCGGRIVGDDEAVISRGVCWSTSPEPTIQNEHYSGSVTNSVYHYTLYDLSPNTTYYCRAFVTRESETVYGGEECFKTLSDGEALSCHPEEIHLDLNEDDVESVTLSISNSGNGSADYWGWVEFEQGENNSTTQELYYHSNQYLDAYGLHDMYNHPSSCVEEIAVKFSDGMGVAMGNQITSAKYYVSYPSVDNKYTFRIYRQGQDGMPNVLLTEKTIESDITFSWLTCDFDDEVYYTGCPLWISVELRQAAEGHFVLSADNAIHDDGIDWYRINGGSWKNYHEYDVAMQSGWMITAVSTGEVVPSDWVGNVSFYGSVEAGSIDEISLNVNSLSLHSGDNFEALLKIRSNVENAPNIDIPITMNVVPYSSPWEVWTEYITQITETSAFYVGGARNGTSPIIAKGACWSIEPNPTLNDSHTTLEHGGNDAIFGYIYDLIPGTTYYLRTYVTDERETYYGNELSFTTLPGGEGEIPEGAINGLFSVGDGQQVYFSKGNLQYQASTNTWKFADNQWDCVGEANSNISPTYDGWIDLFGWGTSGYNHGAVCYQPWSISQNPNDYAVYGNWQYNLYDQTGQADWGYNAISNGGNTENSGWRTLNREEWTYVIDGRNTVSGARFAKASVDEVKGLILLPDNWQLSTFALNNLNHKEIGFQTNIINISEWSILEANGAVFFPVTCARDGSDIMDESEIGAFGAYWGSSLDVSGIPRSLLFRDDTLEPDSDPERSYGIAVRLVYGAGSGSGNGGGGRKK